MLERLEVEDAQQSLLTANQQFIDSNYRYIAGLIDLRHAFGVGDLDELTHGVEE